MRVYLSIRAWVSMFVQQRISETFIYEQLMNSAARSCIEVTSQNSHIRSLTFHKVPRKLKNLFSLILSCGTVKILKIKLEKQFWLIWYNLHLCFRKPSCKMSIDCRNFNSSHQSINHLLNLNIKLILKIRIYKSQARLQEVTSFLGFFLNLPLPAYHDRCTTEPSHYDPLSHFINILIEFNKLWDDDRMFTEGYNSMTTKRNILWPQEDLIRSKIKNHKILLTKIYLSWGQKMLPGVPYRVE